MKEPKELRDPKELKEFRSPGSLRSSRSLRNSRSLRSSKSPMTIKSLRNFLGDPMRRISGYRLVRVVTKIFILINLFQLHII